MPSEVARCTDCGAPLKGVPTWLSNAKVNFTCTNCPKRPSRAARFEPVIEARAIVADDPELEGVELDEIEEDADLDTVGEDLDDPKIED